MASSATSMTVLKDIGKSITLMQKMTQSFGTTSDTIEQRRKLYVSIASVYLFITQTIHTTVQH